MQKMSYILLMVIGLAPTLKAQWTYGLKLGYSYSLLSDQLVRYDDFDDFVIYNVTLDRQVALPHIAFMTMYHADRSDLFVQGELELRQINTNFNIRSDIITDLRTFEESKITRYLMVPIIGGYLTDRFKIGAGPVLALILNQNEPLKELLYFSEVRKPIEAYTRFIVGGLVSNIDIEVFYEYHFNGAAEYIYHKDLQNGFTVNPQFIGLNVGMIF